MNLERDLDPEQLEAVRSVRGPVLVLAGAGSGKTRVLTYRVAHLLLDHGVAQVLAVTFTRKAAEEMRSRVGRLLAGRPVRAWIGTFHALSAYILRREAASVGYAPNFVIYDEDDQRRLLKAILGDLGIPERILRVPAARSEISGAKSVLLDPETFAGPRGPGQGRPVGDVYLAYQDALRRNNAVDFDDLIRLAVRLLEQDPAVLERYRARFPYLLVDEYQDTNHAQYRLVASLAGEHRNLCVVGDDDQSIYTWRGADVSNILGFEKEFPEAKVVRLARSYRCSGRILAGAQALVSKNLRRKPKELWTPNEEGERIGFRLCRDEREEAEAVVAEIQTAIAGDVRPHQIAVLYRTNAQSRALEDGLNRAGIPNVLVGAIRFYDRREVRDVLAYLKVIVNPADSVSLLRILNVPPRGVGNVTVDRLVRASADSGRSLLEFMASDEPIRGLRAKTREGLRGLAHDLLALGDRAKTASAGDVVADLIDRIGYLEYLTAGGGSRDALAVSRVENVGELVAAAREFSERSENRTLVGFLEEVSLLTDIDGWSERPDAVNLMTLHNAKGLEFRVVFITGLEEGLLPHATCLRSHDPLEIEEERRLLYVGLTRAQEKVRLLAADRRVRYQGVGTVRISRFVSEIPEDLLDASDSHRERLGEPIESAEGDEFADEGFEEQVTFTPGAYVRHPDFGAGRVVSVEGAGENLKVTVQFDAGFRKRIVVRYGHLEQV